jgi:hypothetical protein
MKYLAAAQTAFCAILLAFIYVVGAAPARADRPCWNGSASANPNGVPHTREPHVFWGNANTTEAKNSLADLHTKLWPQRPGHVWDANTGLPVDVPIDKPTIKERHWHDEIGYPMKPPHKSDGPRNHYRDWGL